MLAEERREGQRLDKLFLACVVPDRHHFSLLLREVASGAQEELTAKTAERAINSMRTNAF